MKMISQRKVNAFDGWSYFPILTRPGVLMESCRRGKNVSTHNHYTVSEREPECGSEAESPS